MCLLCTLVCGVGWDPALFTRSLDEKPLAGPKLLTLPNRRGAGHARGRRGNERQRGSRGKARAAAGTATAAAPRCGVTGGHQRRQRPRLCVGD